MTKLKANYKPGVKGELVGVVECATGSIRVSIKKTSGHVVNPLMHKSFPNVDSVLAKANALVGLQVQTMVSKTTSDWKADKYFADLSEV